jgi:hypothetical protein
MLHNRLEGDSADVAVHASNGITPGWFRNSATERGELLHMVRQRISDSVVVDAFGSDQPVVSIALLSKKTPSWVRTSSSRRGALS